MHWQVREMLTAGVIEPSSSPWASPAVMVPKAGNKHRMVIDMRKVNAAMKGDAYRLPNMDQILRKLQAARYISTLDLSSAYHQIPLKEDSREIMAFTSSSPFQLKKMPYGLSNVGATFQRMIDRVIGSEHEPYTFSYRDEIITVTNTFTEHLVMLDR